MQKRTLIIISISIASVIFIWLFIAPWMGDGDVASRMLLEQEAVREELNQLRDKYSCSPTITPDCCDGLSNHWASFGRKMKFCKYRSWYVPFWKLKSNM